MLCFSALPILLVVLAALAFSILSSEPIASEPIENFKLLKDFQHYSFQLPNLVAVISDKSELISEVLLTHTAKEDAFYAVVSVFITTSALNIIRAVTPLYLLLLFCNRFLSCESCLTETR